VRLTTLYKKKKDLSTGCAVPERKKETQQKTKGEGGGKNERGKEMFRAYRTSVQTKHSVWRTGCGDDGNALVVKIAAKAPSVKGCILGKGAFLGRV